FFSIKFIGVDPTILPKSASAHEAFTLVNTTFPPNRTSPTYIAIQAPSSAGSDLQSYAQRLRALPGAASVSPARTVSGGFWRVDVVSKARYLAGESQTLVRDIRRVSNGFPTFVGGDAASFVDTQDSLSSLVPYALVILATTTLVLLFLMTGSLI